jgi:hypothetical protein
MINHVKLFSPPFNVKKIEFLIVRGEYVFMELCALQEVD